MAKPSLAYNPVMQFLDTNGQLLSGGTVTFYQPGTTTLLSTYPTAANAAAGTNANPNPITLDTAGRPSNSGNPIDIYVNQSYKIAVAEASGTVIRTVDNVVGLTQSSTVSSLSANYTVAVTDRDNLFVCNTATNSLTMTLLPVATAGNGFGIKFKKMDTSSNSLTIQANASELIDGSNTQVLTGSYKFIQLLCDGTQWIIVSSLSPAWITL